MVKVTNFADVFVSAEVFDVDLLCGAWMLQDGVCDESVVRVDQCLMIPGEVIFHDSAHGVC